MNNIIDFSERTPHVEGNVHCLACRYEWVAVALPGTVYLECPSCSNIRGVWKYPIIPDKETGFICNFCKTYVFMIHRRGARCMGCAFVHSWETILEDDINAT
jgi:hypothetical protein